MSTYTIIQLIQSLFNFYSMLILVYCILTWIPMRSDGLMADVAAVLDSIVGPFLRFFSRILPPMGGIDFSPVIAVLALNFIERLLIGIIL
ncbi:MAG: YggT family protein [Collinsella sp.]|nr:YggT family protein [Collinsella sp.]